MSLPAAADPVIAVVVVALFSFISQRLYAWRAAKRPPKAAMSRIRVALAVGAVLTILVALFALVLVDALSLTASALRAVSPVLADSSVGAVLTWVPTFLGITAAVVSGYLGAFPYVRKIRGLDVSAAGAAWTMTKILGLSFALMVAAVGTLQSLPEGSLTSAFPPLAVLTVGAVVLFALQPRILAFLNDAREPTDAERDRLAPLCETAGVSPRSVRVLDLDSNRLATVILAGLPGRRHLLVTTDLLADFDDPQAAAVIASKTGRAKYYYREAKVVVALVVAGLTMGLASGELSAATRTTPGALALGIAAFAVAFLWLGKRIVYAADDYAVERVGAETFAGTLEALADEHQVSYESGRIRSLLLMRPPVGDRLDRLWGRFGE